MDAVARNGSFRLRRKLYINLSLLSALIVFVGFWPSYFGPLLAGSAEHPLIIHFHAAVFTGWLLVFIAQSVFAAVGRIDLHRKLGNFMIGYGVLLIVVGWTTAFATFAMKVRAGAPDAFFVVAPVLDMLVFPSFFAAAIYYRRKPELHKRLMIVASTALMMAAVIRMRFLGSPQVLWPEYLVWVSPVLIAMAYDFVRYRLVHPVYVIGLAVLTLESRPVRLAINGSEAWLEFNRWLAQVFSA